jgi:hypothetical protein
MRRESHVRFCEGGGVRFPSATRPLWERRTGGRNVTFPARQYSVNGERRSFVLLRPAVDTAANDRFGTSSSRLTRNTRLLQVERCTPMGRRQLLPAGDRRGWRRR